MSTRLDDLISLDALWDVARRRFEMAIRQVTEKAADAEGNEHLVLKGERKGWNHALALLERIRTEERNTKA